MSHMQTFLMRLAGTRPHAPNNQRETHHWTEQAACLGRWDIWDGETRETIAEALTGCTVCPVLNICAREQLHETAGIRGGMTAKQRHQLRKASA